MIRLEVCDYFLGRFPRKKKNTEVFSLKDIQFLNLEKNSLEVRENGGVKEWQVFHICAFN